MLEPRQSISIYSETRKPESGWLKTPSTEMDPPTFVLPENTAPWMLPSSLEEGSLDKILRLQNDFDSPHSAQKQDLLNLELSFSKLISQGQKWIQPGMVFPKQAFRCGPPRAEKTQEEESSLEEMKIWKRAEKRVTQEKDSSLAEMKMWKDLEEMKMWKDLEEMKMWKGRTEFGRTVLRYSRNHCSED